MIQIRRTKHETPALIPDFTDPLGLLLVGHAKIDDRLRSLANAARALRGGHQLDATPLGWVTAPRTGASGTFIVNLRTVGTGSSFGFPDLLSRRMIPPARLQALVIVVTRKSRCRPWAAAQASDARCSPL